MVRIVAQLATWTAATAAPIVCRLQHSLCLAVKWYWQLQRVHASPAVCHRRHLRSPLHLDRLYAHISKHALHSICACMRSLQLHVDWPSLIAAVNVHISIAKK